MTPPAVSDFPAYRVLYVDTEGAGGYDDSRRPDQAWRKLARDIRTLAAPRHGAIFGGTGGS